MHLFRSLVFVSALVGLIVGVVISLVQYVGTEPLIFAAEVYETAAPAASDLGGHDGHDHGTAAGMETAAPQASHEHEHAADAWAPADGFERHFATLVANVLTATGFALVLNGLMQATRQPAGWRTGLAWGLCGFAAVMLAPTLGLHPELPGTPAAPLAERQVWWIATAVATAGGIALLYFKRTPWAAAVALVLIALPHVVGAPVAPEGEAALAPEALSRRFVVIATLTSLVFWALLGGLSGYFRQRMEA
ncbi:CbtA family protein [Ciceribacter sp. RN22]|uniref:CbtA family protein n=1 Tax=Ciceribacter sp. RN22 TaxID=2954932 RepID=UPI0020934860|nr:CbtA family protein [Ciceribacter sp. RN22]MCO6177521.1 CbtA family protein [Ciceribacter sp. RN22]